MGKKKRNKSAQAGGSGAVATEIRQVSTPRPQGYSVAQASKPGFFTGGVFEWLAIATTSLLAFWFLTARIVGVQVSVLADEYLYLLDAHYKGLDEATYPNYLFQWIYSSTKLCGAEFYSCARSINAFFVIFGAVFLYLLAKYVGKSKLLAGLAAIAAILGSYGTYTAYFMPEAIFNGLMMVFFWAIIRFGKTDNLLVWVAIGSSLGIASLAKPHGLFVVPAIVIFVILWTRATKDKWLIAAALRTVVFVGSVVGSKFLFGYLLAGERALSLFGMYGNLETVTRDTAQTITADSSSGTSVLSTAWGQTLMIAMILGVALPVAIHGLLLGFRRDPSGFNQIKTRAVVAISLLNLMAVTAIFEAWQNLGVWMHTRYYTYLIPLALVVLVEAFRTKGSTEWTWSKRFVIVVFVLLSTVNIVTLAVPYGSNWIDAPDFRFQIDNPQLSVVSLFVSTVIALLWLWKTRVAIGAGLTLALVVASLSGGHISTFVKTTFGQQTPYEQIAQLLRGYLPQDELDRILMIGQVEMLQRTAFTSLTGLAEIRGPGESVISPADIPAEKNWLLTIGEVAVKDLGEPAIRGQGYSLFSLKESNSLQPRTKTISSYSNPCQDGSGFACGSEVSISIMSGFSAMASVNLLLEVSEPAADKEIELVLDGASISTSLPRGISSLNIRFNNSNPTDTLVVKLKDLSDALPAGKFIKPIWISARPTN
jgi:phosphoglycerol transferase